LADQLRDDEDVWERVKSEVMPRVEAALRRQFGSGWGWLDLTGVFGSAQRTAYRRLKAKSDLKLECLETLNEFENWLVITARNKFLAQLRHARVENKHAPKLVEHDQNRLNGLADETAEQVVRDLRDTLSDPVDVKIFDGKLEGKPEVQIANELGYSTRRVRGRWRQIRKQLWDNGADEGPAARTWR
jgi:DNA-directed RNA polymerase specialized sigma24 family protein